MLHAHIDHASGSRNFRGRGFALVELLVVVAIIALLIAILLPALSEARAAGRSVQCLSNLRQFNLGFHTYADTHRDYILVSSYLHNSWHAKLGELGTLGSPEHYAGFLDDTAVTLNGFAILGCPAERGLHPYYDVKPPLWRWARIRTSYFIQESLNQGYYGQGKPRKGWSRGPEYGPAKGKPSDALLILDGPGTGPGWEYNSWAALNIDGVYNWDADGAAVYEPWYTISRYAFRHGGNSANGLYWDGHAAAHQHHAVTGKKLFQYHYNTEVDPDGTAPALPGVNFWTYF
jgi:prepilin-type N-terminal cleavage/methylation domain-containing protein/prepilin-type processing-associated H-X9-DG protein